MNASLKYFLCSLSVLLLLFACKEKRVIEDFQVDYGYDYFPLEIGKYWEYSVDSILFDTTGVGIVVEETSSYIREEVVDTFRDNENRLVYTIEQFSRQETQGPWLVQSVKYALQDKNQLEVVENNLRFVKMVFPLEDGEIWNGNLFIDPTTMINIKGEQVEVFKGWTYEIQALGDADVINNRTYDEVLTITQAESENVIELRESVEKYAKGIGLINREMRILDTQCIAGCEGLAWESKAQKGFILRQNLIDHN